MEQKKPNIFIIRHGARQDWEDWNWYTSEDATRFGIYDPPLCQFGIKQAKEVAIALRKLNAKPKYLFASPLRRTVATAHEIAEEFRIPIKCETGVIEWTQEILDSTSIEELKLISKWIDDSYISKFEVPENESKELLFARTKQFIHYLLKSCEKNEGDIIIVTHAATLIALGINLLNYENNSPVPNYFSIRTGFCSISKFEKQDGIWKIVLNGNCSHLSEGEICHWKFEC